MVNRIALTVVFLLAVVPPAGAFHELECGPFRITQIDKKTGVKKCLEQQPEVRRQYLRFRQLKRQQEKRTEGQQFLLRQRTARRDLKQGQIRRTRELVLQQRQRANELELVKKRAEFRQQQLQLRNRLTRQDLKQGQNIRARKLLQQQRQRAIQLDLIDKRLKFQQQQFNRDQIVRQRDPVVIVERKRKIQEGLSRQYKENARRRSQLLENDQVRRRNLLNQKNKLPRANLLEDQKNFNERLLLDQSDLLKQTEPSERLLRPAQKVRPVRPGRYE